MNKLKTKLTFEQMIVFLDKYIHVKDVNGSQYIVDIDKYTKNLNVILTVIREHADLHRDKLHETRYIEALCDSIFNNVFDKNLSNFRIKTADRLKAVQVFIDYFPEYDLINYLYRNHSAYNVNCFYDLDTIQFFVENGVRVEYCERLAEYNFQHALEDMEGFNLRSKYLIDNCRDVLYVNKLYQRILTYAMILGDKDLMIYIFKKTNVLLDGWWKNLAYDYYYGSKNNNREILDLYRKLSKEKEEELKGKL